MFLPLLNIGRCTAIEAIADHQSGADQRKAV
jgi:hypothetical protein